MAQPCESREGAAAAQSTLEGVGPSGRNRIIVHTEYMQMLSSLHSLPCGTVQHMFSETVDKRGSRGPTNAPGAVMQMLQDGIGRRIARA